jgi:hypothetical protein
MEHAATTLGKTKTIFSIEKRTREQLRIWYFVTDG